MTSDLGGRTASPLRGELEVNGDKSISHRSLLVGAICDGPVRVRGFGASADTLATLAAVRALGVIVEDRGRGELVVHGAGLRGLRPPDGVIDVANAGTLMRLLPGILVGQSGRFVLDGDASIRRRPVDRVTGPLALMGADVDANDGLPPLVVQAGAPLTGIEYTLPVASAQVKSCLLLAGLYAEGATSVIEPRASRDHTERLLAAAGARVVRRTGKVAIHAPERLALDEIEVPGDLSSAAPFLVAATLIPESLLIIRNVGVNPGRIGLLQVLERMGARIGVVNRRTTAGGEPVADLEVRSAELVATEIEPDVVPTMVDELPLLALAASCARGTTVVRGAADLRVKESDRIETTRDALFACGAHVEETSDGWRIRGVPARLRGGTVQSHGDHRIAMLGAIAGLFSEVGVRVEEADAIDVSFPEFRPLLEALAAAPS